MSGCMSGGGQRVGVMSVTLALQFAFPVHFFD